MKPFMLVTLLTAVVAGAACNEKVFPKAPPEGSEMSRAILDPYLKIEAALVEDNIDNIRARAGDIATAATALGAPAMRIDTAAVQLAATMDIAAARDRFGALSEAIDTYMTGLHLKAPDGVKVAFCPMLRKPWLQEDAALANPYYGKNDPMAACGDFR
jgi:HPt (histidine-containing phosphotransfer) domain-containing protein